MTKTNFVNNQHSDQLDQEKNPNQHFNGIKSFEIMDETKENKQCKRNYSQKTKQFLTHTDDTDTRKKSICFSKPCIMGLLVIILGITVLTYYLMRKNSMSLSQVETYLEEQEIQVEQQLREKMKNESTKRMMMVVVSFFAFLLVVCLCICFRNGKNQENEMNQQKIELNTDDEDLLAQDQQRITKINRLQKLHQMLKSSYDQMTNGEVEKELNQAYQNHLNVVMQILGEHTFDSSSNFQTQQCVCCQTEFENGDKITQIPLCGHIFHSECCIEWFKSKIEQLEWQCPLCKVQLKMRKLRTKAKELKNLNGSMIYHQDLIIKEGGNKYSSSLKSERNDDIRIEMEEKRNKPKLFIAKPKAWDNVSMSNDDIEINTPKSSISVGTPMFSEDSVTPQEPYKKRKVRIVEF